MGGTGGRTDMDWTEKYRPQSIDDIVGNEDGVRALRKWLQAEGAKDALIIHGPPGVGKTSIAHAVARDEGYDIREFNASNERTGKKLRETFGSVSRSMSVAAERRLVVLDEGDNLDRGGSRAVNEGIREATEPIIIIANDLYGGVPKSIRNKSEIIEFGEVDPHAIMTRLEDICEAEGVDCKTEAITKIAKNADGDMRSAVRDLQSAIQGMPSSREITEQLVDEEYGVLSRERAIFIGPDEVDETQVWGVLTDWFGADQEMGWVIPLSPGFELVVAEYAQSYGFDYEIELPCHHPEVVASMGWDESVTERIEKAVEEASDVSMVYQPERMDEFDYSEFYKWVFLGADEVYGWIDGEVGAWASEGWQYEVPIDRINLAKV